MTPSDEAPGRRCPLSYRYAPSVFRREPSLTAETLYVIGGLYGNPEALHAVLEMKRAEERHGRSVTLVFNGDFHWFDAEPGEFRRIGETVLAHTATRGNVETELEEGTDCGCNYPSYVDELTVARSNEIMRRLQAAAATHPELRRRHATLPMHLTVRVGEARIGILHGDPVSLAGWGFAVENMEPIDPDLRRAVAGAGETTSAEAVRAYFRAADVLAFACTHTCLPFAQDFECDGSPRLVINNGAAGMPNFRGWTAGLVTRVSARPDVPAQSVYGISLGGLRFDALPVAYDHSAWLERFRAHWPPGSPAYDSYYRRLTQGPNFTPRQAARSNVVFD